MYAREILAIMEVVRVWRPYLWGQKFLIVRDQQPLKHLLEQRVATPDQQRWVAKLLGFEFQLVYRPGREYHVADALSRKEDGEVLEDFSGPSWGVWDEIREGIKNYLRCKEVMEKLDVDAKGVENYEIRDRLLKYKGRVVVPSMGDLRKKILGHFHNTKEGGHSGVYRT